MSGKRGGAPPPLPRYEVCPVHHKRIYKNATEAAKGAAEVAKRKGGQARPYECSIGKGYHITHLTEEEYRARRAEWESNAEHL